MTVVWQCWWQNCGHTKLCAKVSELTEIKSLTKINLWITGSACGLFGICHSGRWHEFKFWSFAWLWTEGFSACAQLHSSTPDGETHGVSNELCWFATSPPHCLLFIYGYNLGCWGVYESMKSRGQLHLVLVTAGAHQWLQLCGGSCRKSIKEQ